MALHNTQCPHCFITYVISDEQLRVSEGMVRCGTCRERFQARILGTETEVPRFDPREAFIEPLTGELEEQNRAAEKTHADDTQDEVSFIDEPEETISLCDATVDESINSDLSIDIDDDGPITPVDSRQLSAIAMLANIRAKNEREAEEKRIASENKNTKDNEEISDQHALDSSNTNDEALIDEVDSLVDNKLLSSTPIDAQVNTTPVSTESEPFKLDQKPRIKSRTWLIAPFLLIVVVALGTTLIYQLWTKQILLLNGNSLIEKNINQLSVPVTKKLAEYDIVLPARRNLSKLELVSARTEGHPTRPSTTLLRISVINHAEIEQPLPWLEMTLTDAEGRLISRRNLSPSDYVYQNKTSDLIGARELKKVTIELLSFPKQATGYEVKILNK